MMDIVYILGTGSNWMNNEIRYSLRSLKNLEEKRKVFIVGTCPNFLDKTKVRHIPAEDVSANKLTNAIHKISIACKDGRISESFILMNDDFFFLKPIKEIKTYSLGRLKKMEERHDTKGGYYYRAIKNTLDILFDLGFENPRSFEVHYPIIFEKDKFLRMKKRMDFMKAEPYLFRSVYGNLFKLENNIVDDKKAYSEEDFDRMKNKDFISTDNKVVICQAFMEFIKNKFPRKSIYENQKEIFWHAKNLFRYGNTQYNPGDIVRPDLPELILRTNCIPPSNLV